MAKKRSSTDSAIHNLMEWSARPGWSRDQADVVASHVAPICEAFDLEPEELNAELAPHGYGGMLFGIMFEDFVSRRLPPDDRNVIDDYLKRRGWRESVPGRRYLEKLRDSVLSLYEVVDVSPGEHCKVRDLIRGGGPLRVYEKSGTRSMAKWDRVAARVLRQHDRYIFSGGILPFTAEAAERLLHVLETTRHEVGEAAKKALKAEAPAEILNDSLLRQACPAFSDIWLMHTLDALRAPPPELHNSDGDELLFTTTRFPFAAARREAVIERLDAASEWERDADDEPPVWSWLPANAPHGERAKSGVSIQSVGSGNRTIYGNLEIHAGKLVFSANSQARADRGVQALTSILQDLVEPPLTTMETPAELMAKPRCPDTDDNDTADIDPEMAARIVLEYQDRHYRQVLDEPIPALGERTPRQCAASTTHRPRVIDWLKQLENTEAKRATRDGNPSYDSRWMWEELGLMDELD